MSLYFQIIVKQFVQIELIYINIKSIPIHPNWLGLFTRNDGRIYLCVVTVEPPWIDVTNQTNEAIQD